MPYECRTCGWKDERDAKQCRRCGASKVRTVSIEKLCDDPQVRYCEACERIHLR